MQNKNKNIKPYNKNRTPHGYWEVYWDNIIWYKSFYVNGVIYGYDELYYPDGTLTYKAYYAK